MGLRTLKIDIRILACLVISLVVTVGLRTWLIATGRIPFNADEAVVALMARHILSGERPVFFYGQAYMGSLDAWLISFAFSLFGQQVWVVRLVQLLLTLVWIVSSIGLSFKISKNRTIPLVVACLLAVPPVNVLLYTSATLGGYVEALIIGNALIWWGGTMLNRVGNSTGIRDLFSWGVLGFLVGFGLWVFGLTLVFAIPVCVIVMSSFIHSLWKTKSRVTRSSGHILNHPNVRVIVEVLKRLFWFGIGFVIGAVPWMLYAIDHGISALISELTGGAIAGVEGGTWLSQVWGHFISFMLLGTSVLFGFRPPWDVIWLGLPLIPFILVFWVMVIVFWIRKGKAMVKGNQFVLVILAVLCTGILGFILTPYGADPSGRYFLPLYFPFAIMAAFFISQITAKFRYFRIILPVLLVSFHLWGILQTAKDYPPGITTQFYAPSRIDHRFDEDLMSFLKEHDETRGYTNYWVSYPLAFLSEESLIFVPRLPYHPDFRYTERDDRYQLYDGMVENSDRVAYIVTNHLSLEQHLRTEFTKLEVTWKEEKIGDYVVFYELSKAVRPFEMDLGKTWPQEKD